MSNSKKITNYKFLVIGSNSFSGSNFINYLLKKKHKVIGISRSKEINKVFLPYKKNGNKNLFNFKKIDINKNQNLLNKIVRRFKPSIIINYAAQGMVAESWKNPEDWYTTNLVSQTLLYKNLSKFKFIKKFIHVTTPEVYGSTKKLISENFNFNPSTPYAISRAAMDLHLLNFFKNYKYPVIFTRTANIYGPYQQLYRIVPKALISAKKKIKLELHGGGSSIRSFIYADEASKATYLIVKKGKIGETYHISNSNFISIKNLVKKISKLQNIKFNKLCFAGKERVGKDHSYKLNSNKLNRLGWSNKTNLLKGLRQTKNWIDNNFKVLNKLSLTYKHKK